MLFQEQTENSLTTDGMAVEMALLTAFTAGLLWYYQARDVPWGVSFCVFLSWLLGFVGTLLLPADIVLTLLNGEHRCARAPFFVTIKQKYCDCQK